MSPSPASSVHIHEREIQLVAQLSEKERECLRRWLNHETAKEIALALGVSHHAVEKRLKIARLKLSVNSSIEAARMLARAEGYGQSVAHQPDLSGDNSSHQKKGPTNALVGVLVMMSLLTLAATAMLAPADKTPVEIELRPVSSAAALASLAQDRKPESQTMVLSDNQLTYEAATEAEVREWLLFIFRSTDSDGSGYIEADEAPDTFPIQEALGQIIISGESARTAFIEKHDLDSDRLVSANEFVETSYPAFAERGIPKLPEGFEPAG